MTTTAFNAEPAILPNAMRPALTHEQKWNEAISEANALMADYLHSAYRGERKPAWTPVPLYPLPRS